MEIDNFFKENSVAPCGVNCGVCMAYLRKKKPCRGCWSDGVKMKHCTSCRIKNCLLSRESGGHYCHECEKFPCLSVKGLDKRYRTNYGISLIDNLRRVQEVGEVRFLEEEREKWRCKVCGNVLSVHLKACMFCGGER
ncbi:DUF3795 domain-containing protein [Butyricimonas hominis]